MTRYVVLNNLTDIITENSYYIDPDGTQYPSDYPKNGLPGLSPVADTQCPEFDPAIRIAEDHIELIGGIYTQVWVVRDLTQSELDALKPPPPPPPTASEFIQRFTSAERIAIRTAAKIDPILDDFLYVLGISQYVFTANPNLIAGMGYLVNAGGITEDRKNQILDLNQ